TASRPSRRWLRVSDMGAVSQPSDEILAQSWIPAGTCHHVGFVVASIERSIETFADSIGAQWDGAIFSDPHQAVRVAFLRSPSTADPLIELIEPDGDRSPVVRFLERGGGLHHVCFETPDLDRQLAERRAGGCVLASP